jgi:hypothetical protein
MFAVSEWDLDRTLPYSLRHTCDLIHGSSGSGLIDAKTGKILGVNWGGIKISLDAGVRTDNVATRAKYAQAFLNNSVEDEVKLAAERKSSADAVASKGEGGAIKGKGQNAAQAVRDKCGVVGGARAGALMALLLGLLAPLAFGVTAPSTNQASGWATSYLLNAAMLAEFDAVAPTAGEPERQSLRTRAAFAIAAAKSKAQMLPRAAAVEPLVSGLKAPEAAALGATFPAAIAPHWDKLATAYAQSSPTCSIDADDVKDFAGHQKELLAGDRGVNPLALLKPVAGYDLAKMQCLVFALIASGNEPMHLLNALNATGSPLMKDQALRAMAALRLLQTGQYAETLRALMDLSDAEPSFRLPYEIVQRVFAARQKGEGAVALQGM